jgi:hypothetical protein
VRPEEEVTMSEEAKGIPEDFLEELYALYRAVVAKHQSLGDEGFKRYMDQLQAKARRRIARELRRIFPPVKDVLPVLPLSQLPFHTAFALAYARGEPEGGEAPPGQGRFSQGVARKARLTVTLHLTPYGEEFLLSGRVEKMRGCRRDPDRLRVVVIVKGEEPVLLQPREGQFTFPRPLTPEEGNSLQVALLDRKGNPVEVEFPGAGSRPSRRGTPPR